MENIKAKCNDPWYEDAQAQVTGEKDSNLVHAALYYLATSDASYVDLKEFFK